MATTHLKTVYDSEQKCTLKNISMPMDAIKVHILKALENQLVKRGVLPVSGNTVTPLWFCAETEERLYMWRTGTSIANKHRFSFWVRPPNLIEKRSSHLRRLREDEQEQFSLSCLSPPLGKCLEAEELYLNCLSETIKPLLSHSHALSKVETTIIEECASEEAPKDILLL